MKVAFIDFESQGSDAKTTNITEVGALLIEVDGAGFLEEQRYSTLVHDTSYPAQTPDIVELTGITDEMLKSYDAQRPEAALTRLNELLKKADVALAHNKLFDQTLYESFSAKWN